MQKKTSLFITFEGIEGVGKSTQIDMLYDFLCTKKTPIVKSKEPGGTPFGLKLRKMLLDPNMAFNSPYSEVLLFFADRLEHIETVIKPALADNKIVLCDRFNDSTIAYQIGGRNMPKSLIDSLNSFIKIKPDLTILLDMYLEDSLDRAKKRSALDRFEKEALDFHQRIRNQYLLLAKQEPERVKVIKVDGLSVEEVFLKVKEIVLDYIDLAAVEDAVKLKNMKG